MQRYRKPSDIDEHAFAALAIEFMPLGDNHREFVPYACEEVCVSTANIACKTNRVDRTLAET